jgi:hypothetical protein
MPIPARMALWLSGMAVSLPPTKISPGVGLVEPVQDRHQRGFPRAILADDPVDRALGHRDVDVLVGLHRAEGLGDALQFDGITRIRHLDSPPFPRPFCAASVPF